MSGLENSAKSLGKNMENVQHDGAMSVYKSVYGDNINVNDLITVGRKMETILMLKFMEANNIPWEEYGYMLNGRDKSIYTMPLFYTYNEHTEKNPEKMHLYGVYLAEWEGIKVVVQVSPGMEVYMESNGTVMLMTGLKKDKNKIFDLMRKMYDFAEKNDLDKGKCFRIQTAKYGTLDYKLIHRSTLTLDDIFMTEQQRKDVDNLILGFFRNMDKFNKYNVRQNKGVLLYGPPGNGKTTLGKVLSHELPDVTCIFVTADAMRGAGEISMLYNDVRRLSPAFIFLEDVGGFIKKRQTGNASAAEENLLNALLQELDGPYDNSGLMTIMTTNTKIDEIDEALMRPGRVAHRIKFDEPSEEQAALYIKKNLGNALIGWDDQIDTLVNSVVAQCKEDTKKAFSYAQWNELVNTAKRFALEREDVLEVTTGDMYNALEFVKGLEILDTEKVGFRTKQK